MRPVLRDWVMVRWTSWPALVRWIGRGELLVVGPLMSWGGRTARGVLSSRWTCPRKAAFFAIQVKPSGSSVVRSKVFLLPILHKNQLPYQQSIDWALPLTTFRFKAREWRFVIEGYKGLDWFAASWTGSTSSSQAGDCPPPLEIPFSTMAMSGYPLEDFVMAPQGGDHPPSPIDDPREGGGSMRVSSPPPGTSDVWPKGWGVYSLLQGRGY